MKKIICGIILLLSNTLASAQVKIDAAGSKQLKVYEDSLKTLATSFIGDRGEPERKNANYAFIKKLVTALKIPGSYHYPFQALKNITITNAPNDRFRILTWHVLNDDGTYNFYGAIQMNTPQLQLYPLSDNTAYIKQPEDTVTNNLKWLGAQYYKIIQPDNAAPYYTLLGWKGNSDASTKKVIEVLSFKNDKPMFGMPVFDGNGKTRNRVVFEYSKQTAMMLNYIPEKHLIVFDHLSPPDIRSKDKKETYGPDMTYSGYRYSQGRWLYVDELDLRNVPGANDDLLKDPKAKQ